MMTKGIWIIFSCLRTNRLAEYRNAGEIKILNRNVSTPEVDSLSLKDLLGVHG